MRTLPRRIAALLTAIVLALGAGLVTAVPASAEQADKYVVTNVPDRSYAPPGSIAVKNCAGCSEYNIAPGAYVVGAETASGPRYVMAGNWYGIMETVRVAKNTDPNNREWNTVKTYTYGCQAARKTFVLEGVGYFPNRSNSVESRLTVFECA